MADNWTVLLVGVTETDGYGNLWVTPQGGGDKVKIAEKRSQLHPLFQQGKAVMCNWQTYQNKPYVADAKPIEGKLPPPTEPAILPEHQAEIDKALDKPTIKPQPKTDGKNRSFALAYAKDIAVAKIMMSGETMSTGTILAVAKIFESYLDNGATVEEVKHE